jgi:hypothetical protein
MAKNKNSLYVQSLVDFIRDTKPYHSKLGNITEEYHFFDDMAVRMDEKLFSNVLTKAAWPYSYFSSGPSSFVPTAPFHRIINPQFRALSYNGTLSENRGSFKVSRDENTDLPLVPLAFDPTAFQGVGIADAFIQRNGELSRSEPLLEGHDFFQSHGAYVFQIKQTIGSQEPGYAAAFTERPNEGVLAQATATAQMAALDLSNPNSAVRQMQGLMDQINAALIAAPNPDAQAALNDINAELSIPVLPPKFSREINGVTPPNLYEVLLNALVTTGTPVIPGFEAWIGQDDTYPYAKKYVDQAISALVTALYSNEFTDIGQQEGGTLQYNDITVNGVAISSIFADPNRADYQEYTVQVSTPGSYFVIGSSSGIVGDGAVQLENGVYRGTFNTPELSFEIRSNSELAPPTSILLTPSAKITIHKAAPLEAWSLIKVNPLAYSRPALQSTRYGYISDGQALKNSITVLDLGFPTCTILLTAQGDGTFKLSNTAESTYSGIVQVGTPFNDGRLKFTLHEGTAYQFRAGDSFYIEVRNEPPSPADLDLYYGYDVGPYDADSIKYNTINSSIQNYLETLDFGYDSRFAGYDFTAFNLVIAADAVNNRKWRLRAVADLSAPLPLQNSQIQNTVNLLADDDPDNPDGAQQFDSTDDITAEGPQSATDPDTDADLKLWYANSFELEYYDESISSWKSVQTIQPGVPYNNAEHGLSFTVVPAQKPFIASELNSSWYDEIGAQYRTETVAGGDIISWSVNNPPPELIEGVSLNSARTPRLVMHGDSFQHSIPAKWTLTFSSGGAYKIQGVYTGGALTGTNVFQSPVQVNLATGRSYRNDTVGIHFTVVSGIAGLDAGDVLSFETYTKKPSFLVHGSVSGWQAPAEFDKWYWNGNIGFKLQSPTVQVFENARKLDGKNSWHLSTGYLFLDRVRLDAPTATYILKAHVDEHWMLYRNGDLVSDGRTVVQDRYLNLRVPPAVAGMSVVIQVQADEHELALGTDLGIIKTTTGRSPAANDFVLFERTRIDAVQISIKALPLDSVHAGILAQLSPTNTDIRFIDTVTGSGVPLANTSPETAVLSGWIPSLSTSLDTGSSIAEFTDASTESVVRAAATGEIIGRISSIGATPDEPVIFNWDTNFHAKYLPLNTEATLVSLGSGMNELLSVTMTEGLLLLLNGGGVTAGALFNDSTTIRIADKSSISISMDYQGSADVQISDGPFTGFLPGYDNTLYDFELGTGDVDDEAGGGASYDFGIPLTEYYEQAVQLSLLSTLTDAQRASLADLTAEISNYLVNGDLASTTLTDFLAAVDADVSAGVLTQNFGIPAIGLAFDVQKSDASTAAAAVIEALTVIARDSGYAYDQYGFDVGPMDVPTESTAIVYSSDLPPIPTSGLPPAGTVYADYATPLVIDAPGARVIEVSFSSVPSTTPNFYVWRAAAAQPELVQVVERITSRVFRFSMPFSTEVKLVVG